jgi:diguanylate cyclase (GGDEF)-like protein
MHMRNPLRHISVFTRISLGLVLMTLSTLLGAEMLGLFPDPSATKLEGRKALCEAMAVQSTLAVSRNDDTSLRSGVIALAARNEDVLSVGVVRADGRVLVQVGEHDRYFGKGQDDKSATRVRVPIFREDAPWGQVEVAFREPTAGWMGLIRHPLVGLFAFVVAGGFISYRLYLRKTLAHLDPRAVIPDRVKLMLDTLAEGVLVLDNDGRVVVANRAFAELVGEPADSLIGRRAAGLGWEGTDTPAFLDAAEPKLNTPAPLKTSRGVRSLVANTSPIRGDARSARGLLVTFSDTTPLLEKNAQLERAMQHLQDSRDEIERQNRELQTLASRDALTGCLNRRSMMQQFSSFWGLSQRHEMPLACAMIDVDKFKSVNDRFGHATGDEVLKQVATILQQAARESDVVCRYGGEEFCVLMPHTDLAGARIAAERFRAAIESHDWPVTPITASFGVCCHVAGENGTPVSVEQMLERADAALYHAKHTGRNRVCAHEDVPPPGLAKAA